MATAKPITFVVIGSPGHGKSTVLNEFAQDDIFAVATSGQSCTQAGGEWEERNTKAIAIDDGETKHTMVLVDTPGFPDPDMDKAAQYYDYVVSKCNEPINGVLFILKPERECADIMERYAVLLREFVHLNVPLIILVNGTEVKSRREKPDAFSKRREQGLKDFMGFARNVEGKAQLHAREILVSFCLDDLAELGKDVASTFSQAPPQASNLRTMTQVEELMKQAQNLENAAKQKAEYEQRRIQKCQEDIARLNEEISNYRGYAKGSCFVPVVGWVAAGVLSYKIAGKALRVKELSETATSAELAKNSAGDLENLKKYALKARDEFLTLTRFLRK